MKGPAFTGNTMRRCALAVVAVAVACITTVVPAWSAGYIGISSAGASFSFGCYTSGTGCTADYTVQPTASSIYIVPGKEIAKGDRAWININLPSPPEGSIPDGLVVSLAMRDSWRDGNDWHIISCSPATDPKSGMCGGNVGVTTWDGSGTWNLPVPADSRSIRIGLAFDGTTKTYTNKPQTHLNFGVAAYLMYDGTPPSVALQADSSGVTDEMRVGPKTVLSLKAADNTAITTQEIQLDGNWRPGAQLELAGYGRHRIQGRAFDEAGNVSYTPVFTVFLDDAGPTLQVAPYGPFTVATPTFDVTATDDVGLADIRLSVDGVYRLLGGIGTKKTVSVALPDGKYDSAVLEATDRFGNKSTTPVPFNVDLLPPTIKPVKPRRAGTLDAGDDVEVKVSDSASGVASVTAAIDGKVVPASLEESGLITLTTKKLCAGEHALDVAAVDAAGRGAREGWTFILDGDGPDCSPMATGKGSAPRKPKKRLTCRSAMATLRKAQGELKRARTVKKQAGARKRVRHAKKIAARACRSGTRKVTR